LLLFSQEIPAKEADMTSKTMDKTAQPQTPEETTNLIEEAAYYKWLDRGRYAQPGDELNDWIEAEKEFRDSFTAPRSILPPSKTGTDKRKI
jgi:hypothetical protein